MNNSSARANGFSQYLKVSFADWLVLKEVVRMPQRFIADVTLKSYDQQHPDDYDDEDTFIQSG